MTAGSPWPGLLDDSPLAAFLGIEQVADHDGASCQIKVNAKHLNPYGSLHGGATFAMIDLVMGIATSAHLGIDEICVTSEIRIRYLKPVVEGTVKATATVIESDGRVVQLRADAVNDADEPIAAATGSFVILQRPESS